VVLGNIAETQGISALQCGPILREEKLRVLVLFLLLFLYSNANVC
jgi:hypothetical protein